ncbi:histamine N-methyltransferase-like [Glandiceps talaboti]
MEESVSLSLHFKEYCASFQVLQRHGLASRNAASIDDMNKLFGNIKLDPGKTLKVLAIGTSSGMNDVMIIDALVGCCHDILYTVVEPDEIGVEAFKAMVQSKGDKWSRVTFDYHVQKIEEFLDDRRSRDSDVKDIYDIIHALHLLYFVLTPIYLDLYDMLGSPGIFLIRMTTGGWSNCLTTYHQQFKNPALPFWDGKMLEKDMARDLPGVKIDTTYRSSGPVDVAKCFNEDSEDGNQMLDFIFQCLNFRKSVPKEKQEFFLKYLKDQCSVSEDEILLPSQEMDFTIRK